MGRMPTLERHDGPARAMVLEAPRQLVDALLVGEVEWRHRDLAGPGVDAGQYLGGVLGAPRRYQHRRPGAGQCSGGLQPDPRVPAGHHGVPPGQVDAGQYLGGRTPGAEARADTVLRRTHAASLRG